MKFIKLYGIILVFCYVFVFFGGWMLFDFSNRLYLAVAACAFLLAAVVAAFVSQEERIARLEKRVEELEEKQSVQ